VGDVQRGALESQRALVAALGEGPMRAAWGAVLAATEETLCVDGSALQRRLVLRESVGE
jgi:hypothetical protein